MRFSQLVHVVIEIMEIIQHKKSLYSKGFCYVEYEGNIFSIESVEFIENDISGFNNIVFHCHD